MDDITIGFIGTGVLIVLVLAGVRVVYATATVGLLGVVAMIGWDAGATNIGMIPHSKGSLYALSVLPMFILIGFLAFYPRSRFSGDLSVSSSTPPSVLALVRPWHLGAPFFR